MIHTFFLMVEFISWKYAPATHLSLYSLYEFSSAYENVTDEMNEQYVRYQSKLTQKNRFKKISPSPGLQMFKFRNASARTLTVIIIIKITQPKNKTKAVTSSMPEPLLLFSHSFRAACTIAQDACSQKSADPLS